jgi:phosphoribosyl 1,2-cyclic phosphate phosphodiesterase
MHVDLDYEALRGKLPPSVEPAYDGMRLTLSAQRAAARTRLGSPA